MGMFEALKKVGEAVGKGTKKIQIISARNKEIQKIKEKYLAKLPQRDLERIYKAIQREEVWLEW